MQINKLIQPTIGADLSTLIRINLSCLTVSPFASLRVSLDGQRDASLRSA
jgi:hypothetical protein